MGGLLCSPDADRTPGQDHGTSGGGGGEGGVAAEPLPELDVADIDAAAAAAEYELDLSKHPLATKTPRHRLPPAVPPRKSITRKTSTAGKAAPLVPPKPRQFANQTMLSSSASSALEKTKARGGGPPPPPPGMTRKKSGSVAKPSFKAPRPKSAGYGQVHYPLAALQGPSASLPEGVDARSREAHLSDAVFRETFGMSRAAFEALPKWRQQKCKREANLL